MEPRCFLTELADVASTEATAAMSAFDGVARVVGLVKECEFFSANSAGDFLIPGHVEVGTCTNTLGPLGWAAVGDVDWRFFQQVLWLRRAHVSICKADGSDLVLLGIRSDVVSSWLSFTGQGVFFRIGIILLGLVLLPLFILLLVDSLFLRCLTRRSLLTTS